MNVKFLSSSEKRDIVKQLNEQYGISELPYLLILTGKERIRGYSGSLSIDEMKRIADKVNIEIIGIYLLRIEKDGLRLSHDAISLLRDRITKNIIEINDEQAQQWMRGNDLPIQTGNGYVVLKHNGNLIGCGKSTGDRITNFTPKERRIH